MSEPLVKLPEGQRLWQVSYHHPVRAYGHTDFLVLHPVEPTVELLAAYVLDVLGEEYDPNYEYFIWHEVVIDLINLLKERD